MKVEGPSAAIVAENGVVGVPCALTRWTLCTTHRDALLRCGELFLEEESVLSPEQAASCIKSERLKLVQRSNGGFFDKFVNPFFKPFSNLVCPSKHNFVNRSERHLG
jgi:hypothetical protein